MQWQSMGGGLGVAIFGRRTSAFLISCLRMIETASANRAIRAASMARNDFSAWGYSYVWVKIKNAPQARQSRVTRFRKKRC